MWKRGKEGKYGYKQNNTKRKAKWGFFLKVNNDNVRIKPQSRSS